MIVGLGLISVIRIVMMGVSVRLDISMRCLEIEIVHMRWEYSSNLIATLLDVIE